MNKYLIVGAGGTGGSIAGMMALAGKDVTLIARGEHLEVMKREGMTLVHRAVDGTEQTDIAPVRAVSAEEYEASGEVPDVIFLCTKSYSVREVAPFINKVAKDGTLVITILNGILMGDYVKQYVKSGRVADGCIYIYGMREKPGRILISGDFFRIVTGPIGGFAADADEAIKTGRVTEEELLAVESDLKDSAIRTLVTEDILTETIRKFSFNTPAGGTMLRFDSCAGDIMNDPAQLEFFKGMVRETERLGKAMGADFGVPLVDVNMDILMNSSTGATTSLVRDIRSGHVSEIETLILRPRELGRQYGVDMPRYDEVIACLDHTATV